MTESTQENHGITTFLKHPRTSLLRCWARWRLNQGRPYIVLTAATRHTEASFWHETLLGRYLTAHPTPKNVQLNIAFDNSRGLPSVYNEAMTNHTHAAIYLFVHDDVWLPSENVFDEIALGAQHFDVVGIAGNTRRVKGQPAWLFKGIYDNQLLLDRGHLSGSVRTGDEHRSARTDYGHAPMPCELIDGVLMSINARVARGTGARFDERFTFDFYDMDFCRTAKHKGLTIGTWPIDVIHASPGVFGKPAWVQALHSYLAKWKA